MPRKGYKECPACAEWVRAKAKICRFCGAVLIKESLPLFLPKKKSDLSAKLSQGVERKFAEMGVDLSDQQRRRVVDFLLRSEDEYRAASVLFADITEYTRLCQKLKPEYVKEMIDVYYKFFVQTVEFYNGFVVKFAGDGGMAVFGAPLAYERDAESAVRAALDIRQRIRALPSIQGIKVRISAGIATGEILSSIIHTKIPPHYDVFGPAVNLASRVQEAARSDTVLTDPETCGLVKKVFEFKKIPPRQFKNVDKPIATYVIVGEKKALPSRRDFSIPFVGRQKEKKKLFTIWKEFIKGLKQDQIKGKRVNGAVLVGEAGIGKTRLALEFAHQCPESPRLIHVEGAPYEAKVPWGLWRSVLTSLWRGRSNDPPEKIRPQLESALQKLGFKAEDQATLKLLFGLPEAVESLSSLSPSLLQKLIRADLCLLLELLARTSPLLLILDDLQWVDPTSLELLNTLVVDHIPQRVFFLLLHRSEFKLQQSGLREFKRIRLEGLDEESRNALFNFLTDVQELLPSVRAFLVKQGEGNPFYLIELIHSIKAKIEEEKGDLPEQLLLKKLGSWVPSSLKEMLQARIDSLDKSHKMVLQCGSILGRRFTLQIIELFDHIRDGLLSQLYSLKTLEFLDDLTLPEGLEFLFHHHMTREVAYWSLLERQRMQFHKTIAHRIEEKFSERLSELYPLLAYHYSRSDDNALAIHYLRLAGDHASSVAAITEALDHYDEALKRLRMQKPSRDNLCQMAVILSSKGRLHRIAGEQKLAMDSFHTAMNFTRNFKLKRELTVLRIEIGLTYLQTSHYEKAQKELSTALRSARHQRDRGLLGMALNGLGICAWGHGDFAKARSYFKRTADLKLERSKPSLAADVSNNLALLEWKGGRLQEASKAFKKALRLRDKAGDRFGQALTLMNLGIAEENLGYYARAEKNYREALKIAERIHFAQVMTAVHANLGNLCLVQERNVEALEHSAKALEIAEQIKDRRSAAIALENMALSHLALKQFEESHKCVRKARKLAREINDRERLLSLDLAEIELLLAEDKITRVRPRLLRAQEALEKGGFEAERPRLLRLSAWAHQKAGRLPKAGKVTAQAIKEARRQNNRTEEDRAAKLQKVLKGSEC